MEDLEITPQTETQPSPPEPSPHKHFCCSLPNCKCNTLPYYLAAFLVLITMSGIIYLSRSQKTTNNQQTAVATITLTPTSNPTTNWKTYTNHYAGYYLKYPPTISPTAMSFGDSGYEKSDGGEARVEFGPYFLIIANWNSINPEEYLDWQQNTITINNITADKYQHYNGNNQQDKVFYLFHNKNTNKYIQIYTSNSEYLSNNIFDQILSTFKFTNTNTESYSEDTNIPSQKRYVSPKLGISFLYLTKVDNEIFSVKEEGQKIYIYPSKTTFTSGQFVEVFTKKPPETLKDAITTQFLAGKDPDRCFIEQRKSTFSSSYTIAEISYPRDLESDMEKVFQNMGYCSSDYAKTNGMRYFLGDTLHPTKFVFLSIGQYEIPATPDKGWQDTIQFLD